MFSPYEKGIAPMSASDEFNVTHGEFREGENELWQRILEAWGSMRASTSRLLAEKPSEGRLLFYVLLSDLIFFVSWSLKTLLYPGESAAGPVPVQMGYWLVIAMFFRTSCLYFFSMVIGSAARLMGGHGDWQGTRAAVFWGALVAAPLGLAMGILSVTISAFSIHLPFLAHPAIILAPYALGLLPFVWFISEGVAQVHGFRRFSGFFIVISLICSIGALFGLYLKAQGSI